jgi:very-short-patch-repair endonuclease
VGDELGKLPERARAARREPATVPSPPCGGGMGRGQGSVEPAEATDLPQRPVWHVKPKVRTRARALRRELTKAERIIWYGIRAHRLYGVSFRRQTPIGPYIVDFISHSRKLVIEIDGAQHYEPNQMKRDERRDAFLAIKGYRVLRFNNNDVISNRDGVLTLIGEALEQAPSLPSPASGGGKPSKWRVAKYTAWTAESRR